MYRLLLALLFPLNVFSQVISIHNARILPAGDTVTVRGVVTNGYELGKIRYFQDGTAGIAANPGTGSVAGFETAITAGDSIEVTGVIKSVYGLIVIDPILAFSEIAVLPVPAPKPVSFSSLDPALEGQLVRVECVSFAAGGGVFDGGATYSAVDLSGYDARVSIRNGHPLDNDPIPGTPVQLTGILSRYFDLQILPRNLNDFAQATCFYYTDQPEQSDITTGGFRLDWKTNTPSTAVVRYGTTPALGNEIVLADVAIGHNHTFTDLQSGTIYWVQVISTSNGAVSLSELRPFVTRSVSSGEIRVFFSRSVDPSYSNGFTPNGQSPAEAVAETINRINAAQQTIDVAMYNNNRSDLTNALKSAYTRGVKIRYVASKNVTNSALNPLPAFPVIFVNDATIMHNKFMVIDAAVPDKAWVMTGSMNWTNTNINNDFNNLLFIQDQSLAKAYMIEFEEMWGSSGDTPDPQRSRSGSVKRDNTPHHFIIGGAPVELWFSPSDRTTFKIVDAIYSTDSEALFGLFSFTNNDIGDAMIDQYLSGRQVRGIMENINDLGSEYNVLNSAGIQCVAHSLSGDFHHKYGIFDVNDTDPQVVTGSHNWSFSAEAFNDENTVVIHDYRVASLFSSEFWQRWQELTVPVYSPDIPYLQVWPNPVADRLFFGAGSTGVSGYVVIRDALGITRLEQEANSSLDVSHLPAGIYFFTIQTNDGVGTVPFQKL
jgi:hypothetical protein